MHFSVGSTLLLVAFFLGNTVAEGRDLFDFNREGKNPRWQIVNDGVMGGRSQRFFYGWGQIWRRKYRPEELRRRLIVDPHSPSQYRANGIVSNMDVFYDAFEVPRGSPMFIQPGSRVRIW